MTKLNNLLSEAGFCEVNKSQYFDAIIGKTEDFQERYVREVPQGYHTEKGTSVPNSKNYQIFTSKCAHIIESLDSYALYEISLGTVMNLFKTESTIQKEGIEPKFTGEDANNELVKLRQEVINRRISLTSGYSK